MTSVLERWRRSSIILRSMMLAAVPFVLSFSLAGVAIYRDIDRRSFASEQERLQVDMMLAISGLNRAPALLSALDAPDYDGRCVPTNFAPNADEREDPLLLSFQSPGCPTLGLSVSAPQPRECFFDSCRIRIGEMDRRVRVLMLDAELGDGTCPASERPMSARSQDGPDGCLTVFRLMDDHASRLRWVMLMIPATVLISLAIALLGVRVAAGRLSRRIEAVSATIDAFSDQRQYDTRLQVADTGDELNALSKRVNQSLDRLHESFVLEGVVGRFVAHDIRKSLETMSKDLDARLKDDPDSAFIEDLKRRVDAAWANCQGVSSVLSMRDSALDLEWVQLDEYISVSVSTWRRVAREAGRKLVFDVEDDVRAFTNIAYVRTMLDVLIDNAAAYSPPGADIHLRVYNHQSGEGVIAVADAGDGPPHKIVEAVFGHARPPLNVESARQGRGGHGWGLPAGVRMRADLMGVRLEHGAPEEKPEGGPPEAAGWEIRLIFPMRAI